MKLKTIAALLALGSFAAPAAAQPPRQAPRLIVAIAVDQLSSDLFNQYRQHFTGGLRRLSEGVAFPAGYQGHSATETCPGHSTILTGARPERTGIIANNWFDLGAGREDKNIYCAEDPRVPGSTHERYTVSSYHLRVPTLGDLMRRSDPRSRSVAVAGKDRAAVMMGGHNPNQRWWRGGDQFVSHAGVAASPAVAAVNRDLRTLIARPSAPLAQVPLCEARSRSVPIVGSRNPQQVGSGRLARAAGDADWFQATPDYDAAVLRLALALREEMRLGQGRAPDLLAVGLSATDYVGHRYGTQGAEMCLQLLTLDRLLGDFFAALDASGVDYTVVLTADHGGLDVPERARQQGAPDAARIEAQLNPRRMSEALAARLGLQGTVLFGEGAFGDMYVARTLSARDRERVMAEALSAYRRHPQVAAVFTRAEILAAPPPAGPPDSWSLLQRARASFDAQRSGDFVVLLRPQTTPIAEPGPTYVATHGSPWDYDRQVPILFWRRGLTGFEQPLPVETADIMPTLAALIGLRIDPASIDGRCLDLFEGPESSCQAPPRPRPRR